MDRPRGLVRGADPPVRSEIQSGDRPFQSVGHPFDSTHRKKRQTCPHRQIQPQRRRAQENDLVPAKQDAAAIWVTYKRVIGRQLMILARAREAHADD